MSGDGKRSDGGQPQPSDDREVFGPIDAEALREIQSLFVEMEPLVGAASLDNPLNPQMLSIEIADGVGTASSARIDVRWSLTGNYAFQYSDGQDRHLRFDRHPKPDGPTRHFHPPPDAPSRPVDRSCITLSELPLVTRAVLQRWRYAYETESFEGINDASNPP